MTTDQPDPEQWTAMEMREDAIASGDFTPVVKLPEVERRERAAYERGKAEGQATTRAYEEGIFDAGIAEGLRQATKGPSAWEIRGYIADYGPYASLSWSSGYADLAEARAYFNRTIDDTHAALVLLVEVRPDGWERIADRWRPDAEALAFEREQDAERRLVGPWEPAEQPGGGAR